MAEIGATLREARMRARIDVSEIEAGTKIRAKYLRALENEEWDLLPGPTFVKSFLRTYGQALGLDGRALVEEYKLHYEHSGEGAEPAQQPAAGGRRSAGRRGNQSSGASGYRRGGAGAGAKAGGGGGTYRRGASAAGGGPPRQRPSRAYTAAVSIIGAVIVLLLYALLSGGNGNSPTAPPSVPAANTPHRATAPKGSRSRRARSGTATLASLKLKPTGRVYVCLLADGRVRIPGEIVDPETTLRTYHAKRFELTLGNNALTLVVNGVPREVPASAQPIGYTITRAGIKLLPPSEQPTCG